MGQADDSHFRRHHGVGGGTDFFEGFEQHLPHAGHHAHWQFFSHRQTARAFVGRDRGIIGGFGCDFHDRHPMGDFGKIPQHGHRVCAIGILRGKLV